MTVVTLVLFPTSFFTIWHGKTCKFIIEEGRRKKEEGLSGVLRWGQRTPTQNGQPLSSNPEKSASLI
ncbi:MAG: hypothetical protein QNJ63_07090, partial [Calothrix sp. MO_192.B10]|nr:hypothetical protein [Calothrix sp. MO_192.B10]